MNSTINNSWRQGRIRISSALICKVNRPPLLGVYQEGTTIDYRPHIDMKTANSEIVPWVASQSDLLEDDWVVVV